MFANLTNSGIGSSTGPHMLVGSGMSGGQMCAALFPAADVLLTALPLPLPLPLPSQTCFFVCRVVHLPTALLFPALLQSPCPCHDAVKTLGVGVAVGAMLLQVR